SLVRGGISLLVDIMGEISFGRYITLIILADSLVIILQIRNYSVFKPQSF
ncbi:Bcr/CflA family drug resistance efflux transporter, partial [Staphylococcus xylosus]